MRSFLMIGMMLGLTAAGAQTGARKKAVEKKAINPAPSKPAPQDLSWRQWGGPNRDFKPASQGLADKWPQGGPRRLWSRDLGDGYSAIAEDFAKAHLIAADGKFIVLDEDGNLGLAAASPQGFQVISKVALLTQLSWTPPTLVGTTLFVRDRRVIMALDLGS